MSFQDKLNAALEITKQFTDKNLPTILTVGGLAAGAATVIFTCKATPKAIQIKQELNKKWEKMEKKPSLPTRAWETTKACGKYYLAALAFGVASVALILSANHISTKRTAAFATAYGITQTAFTEYKHKVIETLGEKKEKTIRDEIDKEHIKNNPPSAAEEDATLAVNGEQLCYDTISGRYFYSTMEKILTAVNEINRRIIIETYICLNEFYYEIGLPMISPIGDDLGWDSLNEAGIDITFSSQLSPNNQPTLVLNYSAYPRYNPKLYSY